MSGPAAPARRFAIEYAIAEKIAHPAMGVIQNALPMAAL